jgi:hypothetical protein
MKDIFVTPAVSRIAKLAYTSGAALAEGKMGV